MSTHSTNQTSALTTGDTPGRPTRTGRAIATGLVGLLALGGSIGLISADALAQPQTDSDTVSAQADRQTSQERQTERLERATARIAERVASGDMTQAEADALLERIADGTAERHSHRGAAKQGRADRLQALSDVLGIDAEAITEARKAGMSLADVAEANGVTVDELIDALVAEATERIETKAAEAGLDQAEVDERLDGLVERITERVTADPEDRSSSFGGRRGR